MKDNPTPRRFQLSLRTWISLMTIAALALTILYFRVEEKRLREEAMIQRVLAEEQRMMAEEQRAEAEAQRARAKENEEKAVENERLAISSANEARRQEKRAWEEVETRAVDFAKKALAEAGVSDDRSEEIIKKLSDGQ